MCQTLYEKLREIQDTIDPDRYPQLYSLLLASIDTEGTIYLPPYELAGEMLVCDSKLLLPKRVKEVMESVFLQEIEMGNAEAMRHYASLYDTGRGGVRDYEKALQYYRMAERAGDVQAAQCLGMIYYRGRMGEPDYAKAYSYFTKAALCGNLQALCLLGDMYRMGQFVEADAAQAFRLYSRAQEALEGQMEDPCAGMVCQRMGDAYFYGLGIERDWVAALAQYQKAEICLYGAILRGEDYSPKDLSYVIRQQEETREMLMEEIPEYDW